MTHLRNWIGIAGLTVGLVVGVAGCGGSSGSGSRGSGSAAVTSGVTSVAVVVSAYGPTDTAAQMPDVTALAIELSATGSDPVSISGITLSATGSVDESALGAVTLIGDDNGNGRVDAGEPVLITSAAPAFLTDNGRVDIAFVSSVTLAPGASLRLIATLDVPADVTRTGETVQLSVSDPSDVDASTNGQPTLAGGTFPASGPAVTLGFHDHILITEIVPAPTGSEYVELFNPTGADIDLSQTYLTDANDPDLNAPTDFYDNLPTGQNFGPTNGGDFLVRFPPGSVIRSGQTITVAMDGLDFSTAYGQNADYCLRDPAGTTSVHMLYADASVPPKWSPVTTPGIKNLLDSGERVVIFSWDEVSDLIQDIDYVFYGIPPTLNTKMDKSGRAVDGPDVDTTPTAFATETAPAMQSILPPPVAPNNALQRVDFREAGEINSAGNGITGHDETSEPWAVTFTPGLATPGAP